MTLGEFNACVRGFMRANGGGEEATQDERARYFEALAEAERLGFA